MRLCPPRTYVQHITKAVAAIRRSVVRFKRIALYEMAPASSKVVVMIAKADSHGNMGLKYSIFVRSSQQRQDEDVSSNTNPTRCRPVFHLRRLDVARRSSSGTKNNSGSVSGILHICCDDPSNLCAAHRARSY